MFKSLWLFKKKRMFQEFWRAFKGRRKDILNKDKKIFAGEQVSLEVTNFSDFREIVDFHERIGFWVNKETMLTFPTTIGIIHYSKNGAHIIPAYPISADKMSISISSIKSSLQAALSGAVTSNLRALNAMFNEESITLYFYYDDTPSEKEIENSEVIASEFIADFINFSFQIFREVVPITNTIPNIGISIFQREKNN